MAATFADHLRRLPDDGLATLLRLRPDLVVPAPADVSALAVRAQSRVSVARALDGLDRFHLEVLDAVRLARASDEGATSVDAVLALIPAGQDGLVDRVRQALAHLRTLALVFGPDPALHLVASVDEVSSPYPAGLGRPAAELDGRAAALCADPARLRRTVLAAPPAARAVLDRLAAGPPVGTVAAGSLPDPSGQPTAADHCGLSVPAGRIPEGPSDADEAASGDDLAQAANPVRWLVRQALLVPAPGPGPDARYDLVELPREVGLLLRRDNGPLGGLHPRPPELPVQHRAVHTVDLAGAGQAMELVRCAEAVLEALSAEPAGVLRAGGLGVRDLRRLSRTVGLDEPGTALVLEVGYAAGLLGVTAAGPQPRVGQPGPEQLFLPAAGYDVWRAAPVAQRWDQLARAWLAMTRQVGMVGQRDDRDRVVNALGPEVERVAAPAIRRAALAALARLDPGTAATVEDLLELVAWQAPRRARGREQATREVLAEAALLGLTGLGALTSYGRLLVDQAAADDPAEDDDPLGLSAGDDEPAGRSGRAVEPAAAHLPRRGTAAAALDALLPAPVDHLLVQADLSVVVPGPPEPGLAAELSLVADPESAGGATVYRITDQSVRRALDAGYTARDLHGLFARRSRTPVPQGLTYLIDDAARRHGGLRAGMAGAYLRSDDETLIAEVATDRRLAGLALRRLTPTVLITPYPTGRLVTALRDAGYAPVPEDATGAAVLTRPKPRRAPARASVALRPEAGLAGTAAGDLLAAPRLTQPRLLGIVEQIRRGEAAARAARRAPVTVRAAHGRGVSSLTAVQAHSQALAVLQQAVRDKALVWVGYVDAHGATASRLVRPVSIGAGYLRAEDERTDTLHTFALHRITAAVLEADQVPGRLPNR